MTAIIDLPLNVHPSVGKVVVEGPDDIAFTMTPDAAIETSERLMQAALIATGQEMLGNRDFMN